MALEPGTRLGPYEIETPAGAGGMGEVYRALDTRLERTVAVKVLPEHRSDDADARARLDREAKSISSLSHPGICALYDIGHENGIDYLVMEFLEGQTLADRLDSGRLATGEALEIAVQIAEALAAAHRQGFVHRDLKPGNVMLTRSGAKLLDFGLAKAFDNGSTGAHGVTAMATATTPLTAAGTVLGTFQYMSPEQLEGAEADARSDLFSFGGVLYEMLTGKRAFEGKTQASLIASILKEDPRPVSALESTSPPAVDRLVQRCLAKDPDKRWHSASDLAHELRAIIEGSSVVGAPAVAHPDSHPAAAARGSRIAWILAGLFAIAAVVLGVIALRPTGPAESPPVHFNVAAPDGQYLRPTGTTAAPVAVSPDGEHLVFGTMERDGRNRLWLRSLDSVEARPLQGSEGGHRPFWSPDSRFVGFFAGGELKKAEITGGPALPICAVDGARGGTWNRDGVIVLAPDAGTELSRVSADGGTPQPVTTLDREAGQASHRYPHFLPDGETFLYLVLGGGGLSGTGAESENEVWAASLDGGEPRRILKGAANAEFVNGELLFVRGGALMARPFDPTGLEFTGDLRVVIPEVQYDAAFERGIFSTSSRLLAYRAGGSRGVSTLRRHRPDGVTVDELGPAAVYGDPVLSPDGRQLALAIIDIDEGNTDVWVHDIASGRRTRLTFDPAEDVRPRWSPDGRRLAHSVSTAEGWNLVVRPAAGQGEAQAVLVEPDMWAFPIDWTADGRRLVFQQERTDRDSRVGVLDVESGGEPEWIFEHGDGLMTWVHLSPDNRWLSYASDRTGRWEVYLTSFPSAEGTWQISTTGGREPVWSVDGNTLYFRAGNGSITRAAIDVRDGVPRVANVDTLFDVLVNDATGSGSYDVDAEGRIVVAAMSESEARVPLTVVLDWKM